MGCLSNTLKYAKARKNLKASYIALWKPDLKEQKDFERLVLFRIKCRHIEQLMT